MWLVPVVAVAAVVVMLAAWFVRWQLRWGPQNRVLKSGEVGEAIVLDRDELETATTGGAHTGRRMQYFGSLVLEVHRGGQPAYRARCKQWFESSSWHTVAQGNTVAVRIDRADPQRVFVDGDAQRRAADAAREAERDAHAKRQADLLEG